MEKVLNYCVCFWRFFLRDMLFLTTADDHRKKEREDMNKKYEIRIPALVVMAIMTAFLPGPVLGQLEIESVDENGQLSWGDPGGTGTHYAVEWSAAGLTNRIRPVASVITMASGDSRAVFCNSSSAELRSRSWRDSQR